MLRRFWHWLILPCAACHTRLYFGTRYHTTHHSYCSRRCYQIGAIIEQSARIRGTVRHG